MRASHQDIAVREKNSWASVAVIVGGGVVLALQVGKASIAAPLLRADMGLDLAAIGWLTAVIAVLGMLGGMPAGSLVAARGDRRVFLAGLGTSALGAALGAGAPGYAWLLASRLLEGLGFLLVVVAGPALLQRVVAAAQRDLAFALWSCFMPTGIALAMLLGPLFSSWRILWWSSAALSLAAAASVLLLPPSARGAWRGWRDTGRDALATLRGRDPLLLAAGFGLYSLQFFALFNFLPILLTERMGMPLQTAGLLAAAATAANIAGNLCAGILMERGVARWALVACGSVVMGLAGSGVFLSVLPDAGSFALCMLFSAAGGLIPATLLATAPRAAPSPARVPLVVGLMMQGNNLGQVVGPAAVGGLIQSYGWPAAAGIAGVAGVLALAVALGLRQSGR
ncbi:MFS transporter [Pigmentiphaga sp. GD03639]|uniref:MFS transporter n=1 Tax=Pigmentiphaga sp. GD03639 TaxID=2975354 RepID=UPI00244D296D|nr:MFS transporter [Pigmentiphaga sp. GD03639]MDH2237406.1 MFS transporter [Pigmentiphaga sp. GD03639]